MPSAKSINCSATHAPRRGFALAHAALLVALLLLAVPAAARAQSASGSTLRGVVKDPTGAVVRGATVTLTNKQRGDNRQVKTSDDGTYVFTSIDPGAYSLKVEAQGFKTYEQPDLTIAPTETHSQDVALEVGGATETVTVSAEAASQIKTETGERSETITASQIQNLSIIGRSSLELLRILPGVVAPEQNDLDVVGFNQGGNASANYTVNGIRGVNNQVSIDGSRVIDIGSNNGTIITPNNDMVQEVTVKTSNYAAEYGSSGVQINATTKGGGKDFHGELYDYMRPRQLAANDRSNSIVGTPRPKSQFQFPGGNIGGPILLPFTHLNRNRDKLFFFFGFELQRQKIDAGTRTGIVPTALERAGNFSQSSTPINQTGTIGHICTPDSQDGSCNQVPNGILTQFANPFGVALLNLFPMPNFTPAPGSDLARRGINYASNVVSPQNRTDLKMRFDYNITNNTRMYVRLARESETADYPYGLWWGPSTYELPSHVIGKNLGRSAAVNVTSVINPTMTNEVVFSASKLVLNNDYADPSKVSRASLGLQNLKLPFPVTTPYAPVAILGNWDPTNSELWEPGNLPLFANNDSYSVTDTLSKVYGNHTLKFGGLFERFDKLQNQSGSPEGLIEVNDNPGGQARTTGNLWANIYTGRINQFQQSTFVPTGNFLGHNFEAYGQDSWKLRPNLTVEYGLRFSYFPNVYETNGLGVIFDPNKYVRGAGAFIGGDPNNPNGYLLASKGQVGKSVVPTAPPKFAPRLNVAWDIGGKGKTVLRGGAGVFYNRVQGNYQYGILTQPPNTLNTAINAWGAPNFDLTLSNLGTFNGLTQLAGSAVNSQNLTSNDVPRVTTLSLSLARRLPFQNVLEVAYVGTFGRHLPQTRNYNFFPHAILSGTIGNADMSDPVQRAAVGNNLANLPIGINPQPFPDYSQVTLNEYTGTSNYHSMQVTLNRQFGKNFQYFITYTFSKALGTTSVQESSGSDQVDPIDTRGRSYGILPFDRTHLFNMSYNYNFPDLARGSWRNKLTKGVFNGWQMSGITTFESGRPIRLKFTGALSGVPAEVAFFGTNAFTQSSGNAGAIAPILMHNPQTGSSDVGGKYLDLSAIQIPGFGQSGPYQSPFYIRSPSRNNFDVTFFKNFGFTETKKLQVRVGLFNAFNEAFANPDLGDINLTLETQNAIDPSSRTAANPQGHCFFANGGNGVNNGTGTTTQVCDPTKGYTFTQNTLTNFGTIVKKHGHRRIELALKFYF
jgi:Carboxypeptidase regulatory-like domain/TonB-dependent Receptor Plug Domain